MGQFDAIGKEISWCPGCGNFPILNALKSALEGRELKPRDVVMVSGIGQAAKLPHYMIANVFNGLHGRSLPVATGIKAANPGLTVIAVSGDGCMYGEGGNHFLHAIRRNPDITMIVNNNMVYGLTKGQASPTSPLGLKTPIQIEGVTEIPFNPVAIAIAAGASFVARSFAGDADRTRKLIDMAIGHKGFALVDIFQPCVSFNKVNTYQWFKDNTYAIEDSHDAGDPMAAMALALREDRLPLGLFYRREGRSSFEETLPAFRRDKRPLYDRPMDLSRLRKLIDKKRTAR